MRAICGAGILLSLRGTAVAWTRVIENIDASQAAEDTFFSELTSPRGLVLIAIASALIVLALILRAHRNGKQSEADHPSKPDRLKSIAAGLRRLAARAFENPGPLFDEERKGTVSRLLATFARHVDVAADALRNGEDMHGRPVSPAQVGGLLAGVCGECRRLVERVAEVCGSEVTHYLRDFLDKVSDLADEMARSRNGDIDNHTPAHAAGCAEAPQASPLPHKVDDSGTSGETSSSPSAESVSDDRGPLDAREAHGDESIDGTPDGGVERGAFSAAGAAKPTHPINSDQHMSGGQEATMKTDGKTKVYVVVLAATVLAIALCLPPLPRGSSVDRERASSEYARPGGSARDTDADIHSAKTKPGVSDGPADRAGRLFQPPDSAARAEHLKPRLPDHAAGLDEKRGQSAEWEVWADFDGIEPVSTIAVSPDSRALACACYGGSVRMWDLPTQVEVLSLGTTGKLPTTMTFSPDGKMLAWGTHGLPGLTEGEVHLLDVSSGQLSAMVPSVPTYLSFLAFSPDGTKLLASCHNLGFSVIWTLPGGKESRRLDDLTCALFSPDSKLVAGIDRKGGLALCNTASGSQRFTLRGYTAPIGWLDFSPDGTTLASGGGTYDPPSAELILWDVHEKRRRASLQGHTREVISVSFSPDGKTLASFQSDLVILWDMPSARRRAVLRLGPGSWRIPLFSPDSKRLAVRSAFCVREWDAMAGRELSDLRLTGTEDLAYSPDGNMLAVAGSFATEAGKAEGYVRVWGRGPAP